MDLDLAFSLPGIFKGNTSSSVADIAPQQAEQFASEHTECASGNGESALTGAVLDNAIRRAWVHAIYRRNSGHRAEYHKSMDIYRKLAALKALQQGGAQ